MDPAPTTTTATAAAATTASTTPAATAKPAETDFTKKLAAELERIASHATKVETLKNGAKLYHLAGGREIEAAPGNSPYVVKKGDWGEKQSAAAQATTTPPTTATTPTTTPPAAATTTPPAATTTPPSTATTPPSTATTTGTK